MTKKIQPRKTTRTRAQSEESFGAWLSRHMTTIKGVSLLVVGLLLIGITSPVIVRLMILIAGGFLVYSGLLILRAHQLTDLIEEILNKFRGK